MRSKKAVLLLLILLLSAALCSCSGEKAEPPDDEKFNISLQTTAGTGYYWDCALSEEGIVAVESIQDIPDDLSPGSSITTVFSFTGKKQGSVSATFCCQRSWDDSVTYQQTCDMEVDWDRIVTGELSLQTATIRPGDGIYKLSSTDSSIALWDNMDDNCFTFTPMHSGFTVLTFTPLNDPMAPVRSFYLRVADDNTLTITEQDSPSDTGSYSSPEELEKAVGFFINAPEGSVLDEISSAGGMAYLNFTWENMQFAYVAGELDLDAFRTPDADILTAGEYEVIVSRSGNTVAAWEANDIVYYISCEQSLSDEDLLALLDELLPPPQTVY